MKKALVILALVTILSPLGVSAQSQGVEALISQLMNVIVLQHERISELERDLAHLERRMNQDGIPDVPEAPDDTPPLVMPNPPIKPLTDKQKQYNQTFQFGHVNGTGIVMPFAQP